MPGRRKKAVETVYGWYDRACANRLESDIRAGGTGLSFYGDEVPEGSELAIRDLEDRIRADRDEADRLLPEVTNLRRRLAEARAGGSERLREERESELETVQRAYVETTGRLAENERRLGMLRDAVRLRGMRRSPSSYVREQLEGNSTVLLIDVLFGAVILADALFLTRFVRAFLTLDVSLVSPNIFLLTFASAAPFLLWMWSTCYAPFRFWNRKFRNLRVCVYSLGVVMATQGQRLLLALGVWLLRRLPSGTAWTGGESAMLTAVLSSLGGAGIGAAVVAALLSRIGSPEGQETLRYYRFDRGKDFRRNREFMYDLRIVRVYETGRFYRIKFSDRFLHMLIDGATGTGKTSILIINAVLQDLDQCLHNLNYQKKAMYDLLRDGRVRLTRRLDDGEFSTDAFEAVPTGDDREDARTEKELGFIREVSTPCGVIVVGPNDGFCDDVYGIAKNRNFRVYRIDPILERTGKLRGQLKQDFVGFNPLYVSPLLEGSDRNSQISVNAQNLSDTLIALNQKNGSVDSYFEGVAATQVLNVAILLQLVWPELHGRMPNVADMLECLYDFRKLYRPYAWFIQRYGNNGSPLRDMKALYTAEECPSEDDVKREVRKVIAKTPVNCGPWNEVFQVFTNTLLDDVNGPVQYERANGLRNQFERFLLDERVKRVLCAENVIDFDQILRTGGVVVFNYALELGESISATLGQFFTVAYSKAVLRRDTARFMIPFFTYIDEFPTILNKNMEELFSLHRQYRCSNTVCLQTLMQMDKTEQTRYFKTLLMQNTGQQFLFGRLSTEEMRDYEAFGGMSIGEEVRRSVTQNALSSENPTYSESTAVTQRLQANMTGSQMRYNDFKEMTVFATDDGSPVLPFKAMGDFATPYMKKSPRILKVDWDRFWTGEGAGVPRGDGETPPVTGEAVTPAVTEEVDGTPVDLDKLLEELDGVRI